MSTEAVIEKQAAEQALPPEPTRYGQSYQPKVDILERAEELLIVADMPGAKADAIDIHFEDGELVINAPVVSRYPREGRALLQEYGVGDFNRTFRVSERINATGIRAEYAHGVLTVHLPKVESAKPRKIAVQVG